MRADEKDFVDQLKSLAKLLDAEIVRQELAGVQPEDLAEAFQRIELDEALNILGRLDDVHAADVLVELPSEIARPMVAELPDSAVAHYLDILPMDDALDLKDELGEERFEALLNVIPLQDAQEIRRLMGYPEGSVGRLMTEGFFEVLPDMTMSEVLSDIRRAKEEKYETVNDVYVLDYARHLLGVFSLRKAIRADPTTTAREMMRPDVVTCLATDSAESAARQMSRYGFYGLPVQDGAGRMVGLFTGDDAQSVLREADTEDVLKLGAVGGQVEAYISLNVLQLVKRRLPWLLFLFVAETFTGSVLRLYIRPGEASAAMSQMSLIAQLTLFLPLMIGAGGNSGSQVTTTITRALAVGEIRTSDALLVWRREISTALIIGACLGLAGFGRAFFGWSAGWGVSLVVGLALPSIVLWAAIVGSVLPLTAKRVKIDPAVMSAPFISTFVDATGIVIFFEIARRVLGLHF